MDISQENGDVMGGYQSWGGMFACMRNMRIIFKTYDNQPFLCSHHKWLQVSLLDEKILQYDITAAYARKIWIFHVAINQLA